MTTFRTTVTVTVSAALVVGLGIGTVRYVQTGEDRTAEGYCAFLSDAIGLYVGNPVTHMGYPVGTVDKITTDYTDVRVDFSLDSDHAMPADAKAMIRSASLLADRSFEIVGNYEPGPRLEPGACIPLERTATPKSISEIVGSAADFVNQLSPDGSNNIAGAVAGVDRLIDGRGDDIGALLTSASALLDSPDQAIADMGAIVRALAELTGTLEHNTDPLKEIVLALPQTTNDIADALHGAADLVGALPNLIVLIDDLEERAGQETTGILDTTTTLLRIAASRADDIAGLLDPLPGLIGMTAASARTRTGFAVTYQPPAFRVTTTNGPVLCGLMNASMPESCAVPSGQVGQSDISLLQLVLAEAGR
jgi:phospholipid/cholesterol/gamma-HCH transport system substrate-binding protein